MPSTGELKIPFGRSFGIEFEFTRQVSQEALREAILFALPGIDSELVRIADYEHTPTDNADWVVKRDGSCGWEICTPRCETRTNLDQICSVLQSAKRVGAKVGPRCGTHIHYGTGDLNEKQLAQCIAYWVKMEGMLFFSLPRKRRSNPFCLSLSRSADIKVRSKYGPKELISLASANRYRALNIKPHLEGKHRMEVRVIEGTMDPTTIWGYTCFFLHFFHRCRHSELPQDLKWFSLDQSLEWLQWYQPKNEESSPGMTMDREMAKLRDWWLCRIAKNAGTREKAVEYKKRAKEFLGYFREKRP